jgi:hypothetical protein
LFALGKAAFTGFEFWQLLAEQQTQAPAGGDQRLAQGGSRFAGGTLGKTLKEKI